MLTWSIRILFYLYVAISCGKPGQGTNTAPVANGTDIKFGQQYVYSCDVGFKFATDSFVIKCTENGTFDPTNPAICTGRCNKQQNVKLLYMLLSIFCKLFYVCSPA